MNFHLVPKYTKYNNSLRQIYFAYVPPVNYRPTQTVPRAQEPSNLPVPITITRNRRKSKFYRKNWGIRKKSSGDVSSKKPNKVVRWYAKKKALREFEKENKEAHKKFKELEKWKKIDEQRKLSEIADKARREREAEVLDYLIKQQKEQARIEQETREYIERNKKEIRPKKEKIQKKRFPKIKFKRRKSPKVQKQKIAVVEKTYDFDTAEKKKPKNIEIQKPSKVKIQKIKTPKTEKRKIEYENSYDISPPKKARIEPVAQTPVIEEYVVPKPKKVKKPKIVKETRVVVKQPETIYKTVKRPRLEKFSVRFVNCFYRLCCEFYCWMTIILAVGLALIFLL